MKRCPECRRDYYDDSLAYCLDDGAVLVDGPAADTEPATAVLHETAPQSEAKTRSAIHATEGPDMPSQNASPRLQRKVVFLMIAVLSVLLLAVGYGALRMRSASGDFAYFKNIQLTRITSEGTVESAAMSPDGKYIAYTIEESGKRSLWTKILPATAAS